MNGPILLGSPTLPDQDNETRATIPVCNKYNFESLIRLLLDVFNIYADGRRKERTPRRRWREH